MSHKPQLKGVLKNRGKHKKKPGKPRTGIFIDGKVISVGGVKKT